MKRYVDIATPTTSIILVASLLASEAVPTPRALQRAFVPPRPDERFVAWSQLPSEAKLVAVETLGYDENGWNFPGIRTIEIEGLDYNSLTMAQQEGVEAVLNINVSDSENNYVVWDCWINHFENYAWEELAVRRQPICVMMS
mgnify:CR=1 FL=1